MSSNEDGFFGMTGQQKIFCLTLKIILISMRFKILTVMSVWYTDVNIVARQTKAGIVKPEPDVRC
jgi:hypothetical protein